MIQLAAQERSRRTQWLRLFVPVSQVAELIAEMTPLAPLERIRNAHCRGSLVSVPQAAHEPHLGVGTGTAQTCANPPFAGCARADVRGLDGRHFQVLVVEAVGHTVIS